MKVMDLKKLKKLIVIQELTHREIAEAAGWSSHTYVGRLLRGEVDTLKAEPAVAIAKLLGCPVDDIFLTRIDSNVGAPVQESKTRRTRTAA